MATLRRWREQVGRVAYPQAERPLVTADAGESNGYQVRAWKTELARFAAETDLQVTVCHLRIDQLGGAEAGRAGSSQRMVLLLSLVHRLV